MKIQKIVAVLLISLLAVGSVFASNNAEADSEVVTLKVLLYGDPADPTSIHAKTLVEQFNVENEGSINVEYDMLYDEIYHQKLQATLAGGEQLDMYYGWNGGTRHQPVFDAAEDIDLRDVEELDFSKYPAAALSPDVVTGKLLTLPEGTGAHSVFFANEDLLAENGLTVATTYEELVAQDAQLKAKGLRAVAYAGSTSWCHNTFLYATLVARYGGQKFVDSLLARDASFTDAVSVQALEMTEKIYADGVFDQITLNTDYGTALAQFNNGEAAYYWDGGWRGASITLGNFSWNNVPAFPGEKFANASNGGFTPGNTLTKTALDSPRRAAAIKLFNYMHNAESAIVRANVAGIVPVVAGVDTSKIENPQVVAQSEYLSSLDEMAITVGDRLPGPVVENFTNGIINLWLGADTAASLAESTQAIYEEN